MLVGAAVVLVVVVVLEVGAPLVLVVVVVDGQAVVEALESWQPIVTVCPRCAASQAASGQNCPQIQSGTCHAQFMLFRFQ